VDEIPGRSLEIRVKKLATHDMNIKQIDMRVAGLENQKLLKLSVKDK
jgi:hypothetical protein